MITIAVDFDDTLVPFIEPFLKWHNDVTGSMLNISQVITYKFSESFGGDLVYWENKIEEFNKAGIQEKTGPYEGAIKVITNLAKSARLIVLTSRPEKQRQDTQKVIDLFFPHLFKELHMRDDYSETHDKGEVCKHLGASILIDDAGHNIVAAQRAGIQAIMFGVFPSQAEHIQNYPLHAQNWDDVERMIPTLGVNLY